MRIWIADIPQIQAAVQLGDVMRTFVFAEVSESHYPDFKRGDKAVVLLNS